MENETKSSGRVNKAVRIAGAAIVVFFGLAILSVILGKGTFVRKGAKTMQAIDGPGYGYSGNTAFSPSAPAGMPEDSSGFGMQTKELEYGETISSDLSVSEDSAGKKITKNGDLSLKVDSAEKSAGEISDIAGNNGGETLSSNFYQSGAGSKSGFITVKVPVGNFEKTFSEIKNIDGVVIRESVSGQDVTEEYSDLQARLKNKQAEEEAYLRIFDQARKIDDILAVQRQLSQVRGEIERLQGRIKMMDSHTEMSRITVNLTENANITVLDKWRPWQEVKDSAGMLVKKLQEFVNFLIRFVVAVLPILVLYGILVLVIYKIGKRVYLKFREKDESVE